ncbi:hypothetical protein PgNI_06153 [Pyricularia grisea]|uniref:Uncharacterized protein n=1 Tax=Pyricularia grisea TaxID=148305 RepID=A0A6P8B7J4_PYRGI|nr:hypothetical protein PgNI_06153 [Pyricularia grisea]TLD11292.1 hypothetical protein PgNI_06153 [Pyricularia grisea]
MGTSVGRFMGDCDTKICHREGRRMVAVTGSFKQSLTTRPGTSYHIAFSEVDKAQESPLYSGDIHTEWSKSQRVTISLSESYHEVH